MQKKKKKYFSELINSKVIKVKNFLYNKLIKKIF